MKVVATDEYQKNMVQDGILQRIPMAGEEFEISEERYEVLSNPEKNSYGLVFVKPLREYVEEIETAKEEVETEKAVKKTTKKSPAKRTTKKKAE